jgi:hypothetical protein
MAELPPIEALALPFTFGMAIGLSVGRVVLQSTAIGLLLGVLLVVVFVGLRQWLVS